MDGILLVDKPRGVTSHDVVSRARRALGTRQVGHAGTLDPMATGLLVVLVGEATKLSAWLTLDQKRYLATVRFGSTTDTLDADGTVTALAPEGTPAPTPARIHEAVRAMVGPSMQVPPVVSAIKVGGVAMHERTRRGESVELAPRPVELVRAVVLAVREDVAECDLDLTCSKGFYVRSFARDLAESLGTYGHLTALRRLESGAFTLDGAFDGDALMRAPKGDESVRAALAPLVSVARAMRTVTVDDAQAKALGYGQRVACEGDDGVVLVLREDGTPVCVGTLSANVLSVSRGLHA
jgi:tRNA pseudouridine55 synthase